MDRTTKIMLLAAIGLVSPAMAAEHGNTSCWGGNQRQDISCSTTTASAAPEQWWGGLRRADALFKVQQAAAPTCAEFMTRLNNAGRAMRLQLPPFVFERDISLSALEPILIEEFWLRPNDDRLAPDGGMECQDGRVFWAELEAFTASGYQPERTANMTAALVYAYRGWPAAQVIETARQLVLNNAVLTLPRAAQISVSGSFIKLTRNSRDQI